MNLNDFSTELADYNPNSRIWIYQANKLLNDSEVYIIKNTINPFTASWAHHGVKLKAHCGVLYNLFIVFAVDENHAEVGGCGIDSSVHLVQKLGQELKVDFFNRLAISFFNEDKVECISKECFSELIKKDKNWSNKTLVFNNQVKTLEALKNNWIIPFENSWHKNFFSAEDNFTLSL